jgi:hypothetical protein
MNGTGFRVAQSLYWVSLGTWFGAMVMIFLAARSTFAVLPTFQPSINAPPYNHPALAEAAPRILAGAVNGDALRKLGRLAIACAVVSLACVVIQCTAGSPWLERGGRHWANYLRIALIVLPTAILAFDALVFEPRILKQRDVIYSPDLTAEQRQQERRTFGKLHGVSMLLATAATASLLGALVVSPFAFRLAEPAARTLSASPATDPRLLSEGAARG